MKNQCFVLLSRSSLAPFGQHSQLHFVLQGVVQWGLTDKQMQGHRDQLSSPTRIITIWKAKCIKTALIFLANTTWEAGHVPASRKALFWRNGDVKPSRAPRTSVSPAPRLPTYSATSEPLLLRCVTNSIQALQLLLEMTWKTPACSRKRRQRSKALDWSYNDSLCIIAYSLAAANSSPWPFHRSTLWLVSNTVCVVG